MKYAIVKILDEKLTPRWTEFEPRYLDHARGYKAESTIRYSEMGAIQEFRLFIKDRRLGDFTTDDADRWKNLLSRKFAQNTVRRRFVAISGVFDYAVSLKILTENPFKGVEPPPQVHAGRALSDHELASVFRRLPLDIRRACTLALYTGLRRQEVFSLTWQQITGNILTIPPDKSKSKRGRSVHLHRQAVACLGPVRKSGRVFLFSASMMNYHLTRAWRAAGVGRVRFHDLRHTSATRFMEQTPDLFALMDTYGWASPKSALPYQHITANRQAAILKIDYKI